MLEAVTFLSPGIPFSFFEVVTSHLAAELGREVRLAAEERHSGPMHGDDDPFADGRVDLGFLCSPSYLYLRSKSPPTVELVPAGFVSSDPRAAGHAVYFSEVIVRRDDPASALADLRGRVWGFNDRCSLSGYFAALQEVEDLPGHGAFFSRLVCTGSHARSIDAVVAGAIDGAAIDSNGFRSLVQDRPELGRLLRVVESIGPLPIQPIVVRAGDADLRDRVAAALLGTAATRDLENAFEPFGFERCAAIEDSIYDDERRALEALGVLQTPGVESQQASVGPGIRR